MHNRRDFLKRTGLLGTAAVLSQAVLSKDADGFAAEEISGEPPKAYTLSFENVLRGNVPPKREITIPDVGEYRVLKGDFHIHTLFSDGTLWPQERVNEAVGNGLDVIAITDHIEYRPHLGGSGVKLRDQNEDYDIAYNLAKPVADRENLLLVRGTEITKMTMPPGHFNVLFHRETGPIAAEVNDYRMMLEAAVKQGAFLLWNHPGWQAPTNGGIENGAPILFTEVHEKLYQDGLIYGVECCNHYEYYPNVCDWCEEKELAIFANSDIHRSEFDTYGVRNTKRPITLILAKERTLDSVKEAFFAGRTIAWFMDRIVGREKFVRPLFEASVSMERKGERLVCTNKSDLPVHLEWNKTVVVVPQKGTAELQADEHPIFVANWFIGTDKPLRIIPMFDPPVLRR
ncbi:MAG: twin-arginine translocation signal domain-containing protein [Planctomycetaceae bacterium]|nr:twin-arginine translocation signal domain-containing protein [Planctomycetaceae bacterium]